MCGLNFEKKFEGGAEKNEKWISCEGCACSAKLNLLDSPGMSLDTETLLAGFEAWSVRAAPYAYARDETGETTLGLIEADPFADGAPPALLSDSDWLRLQAICGG